MLAAAAAEATSQVRDLDICNVVLPSPAARTTPRLLLIPGARSTSVRTVIDETVKDHPHPLRRSAGKSDGDHVAVVVGQRHPLQVRRHEGCVALIGFCDLFEGLEHHCLGSGAVQPALIRSTEQGHT
jgi:hypothetical protein